MLCLAVFAVELDETSKPSKHSGAARQFIKLRSFRMSEALDLDELALFAYVFSIEGVQNLIVWPHAIQTEYRTGTHGNV